MYKLGKLVVVIEFSPVNEIIVILGNHIPFAVVFENKGHVAIILKCNYAQLFIRCKSGCIISGEQGL